jgi:hypothetical protein
MEEPFLTGDAYEFYKKFREYEKQGVVTRVVFGAKNKTIRIYNGKMLMRYDGDEVLKLAHKINRRLSE